MALPHSASASPSGARPSSRGRAPPLTHRLSGHVLSRSSAATGGAGGLRVATEGLRFSKYEEIAFSIVFTMAERSTDRGGALQRRLLPLLFALLDALQLAGLVDRSGWDPGALDWAYRGPDLYPVFRRMLFASSFAAVFWTAAAGVLVMFALTGLVAFTMRLQRFHPLPLRILRLLLKVVLGAIFISTLQVFTSAYTLGLDPSDDGFRAAPSETAYPPWSIYAAVATICLASLIPYAAAVTLLLVDFCPISYNIEASPHGRVKLFYLLCQVFLVFVSRFLHFHPPLLDAIVALVCLANVLAFVWFQPYFSAAMNRFRALLFGAVAFYGLCSSVLATRYAASGARAGLAASVALLLSSLAFGGLCAVACALRYYWLADRPRHASASAAASAAGPAAGGGANPFTHPHATHRNSYEASPTPTPASPAAPEREEAAPEADRDRSLAFRWFGVGSGFVVEAPVEVAGRSAWRNWHGRASSRPEALPHSKSSRLRLAGGAGRRRVHPAPTSFGGIGSLAAGSDPENPGRGERAAAPAGDEAEAVLRAGLDRYPGSAYLHVCLAALLEHHTGDAHAAVLELRHAMQRGPGLDLRYQIASKRMEMEQASHQRNGIGGGSGGGGPSGGANFISVLEFRSVHEQARAKHALALRLCKSFWAALAARAARPHAKARDLGDLSSRLQAIETAKRAAADSYGTLLHKFPNSKMLLRSYGAFLLDVENDPRRAQESLGRAEELEELESRADGDGPREGAGSAVLPRSGTSLTGSRSHSSSSKSSAEKSASAQKAQRREARAVRLLSYAVVLGLLFAGGLMSAVFAEMTVLFKELLHSVFRQTKLASQQRTFTTNMYWLRMMMMYAYEGQSAAFEATRSIFAERVAIQRATCLGLVLHGWPSDGVAPSGYGPVLQAWNDEAVRVRVHVASDAAPGQHVNLLETTSLWSAFRRWVAESDEVAALTLEQMQPNASLANAHVRFLLDNAGLGGIQSSLEALGHAYAGEMAAKTDEGRRVLAGLLAATYGVLLVIALGILNPSIKRVQATKNGVAEVALQIPLPVLREIAAHYRKTRLIDEDAPSQSEDEAEEAESSKPPPPPPLAKGDDAAKPDAAGGGIDAGAAPAPRAEISTRRDPDPESPKADAEVAPASSRGEFVLFVPILARSRRPSDEGEATGTPQPPAEPPFLAGGSPRDRTPVESLPHSETGDDVHHNQGAAAAAEALAPRAPPAEGAPPPPPPPPAPGARSQRRASAEGPPKAGPRRRKAERDVFHSMRVAYTAAFLALAAIATANFGACMWALGDNAAIPAEIRVSGLRQTYVREMHSWALELAIDDGELVSRQEAAARLGNAIALTDRYNKDLLYGDAEHGTAPIDYGPQKALMYTQSCLRKNAADCTANRSARMSEVTQGLDWAITAFERGARRVAESTGVLDGAGAFRADLTADESAPRPQYGITSLRKRLPSVGDLEAILFDVDQGCELSTLLYGQEASDKIQLILSAEGGVLAAAWLIIAAIYVFLFRRMIRRLEDECQRTSQFLGLIPRHIAARAGTAVAAHAARENGSDEEGYAEEADGAEGGNPKPAGDFPAAA